MFEQLHQKVSESPINIICPDFDQAMISQTISDGCATTLENASLIADLILTYVGAGKKLMKGLRASAVCWLTGDFSWPIVEWVEGDDRRNIAIFHFDDEDEPKEHSWIMHSGICSSNSEASEMPRWQSSRLDWNVEDISHLKTLFKVAQHLLGILEWPFADAYQLYCERNAMCHSIDEYFLLEIGANLCKARKDIRSFFSIIFCRLST